MVTGGGDRRWLQEGVTGGGDRRGGDRRGDDRRGDEAHLILEV